MMTEIADLLQVPLTVLLADLYVLFRICNSILAGQLDNIQYLVNVLEFHVNKLKMFASSLARFATSGKVLESVENVQKLSSVLEYYIDILRDSYITGRGREVRRGVFEVMILLFKEREVLREIEDNLFEIFKRNLVDVP